MRYRSPQKVAYRPPGAKTQEALRDWRQAQAGVLHEGNLHKELLLHTFQSHTLKIVVTIRNIFGDEVIAAVTGGQVKGLFG